MVEEMLRLIFGVFEYKEMFMDIHVDIKEEKHNSFGFVQTMLIIHGKLHQALHMLQQEYLLFGL